MIDDGLCHNSTEFGFNNCVRFYKEKNEFKCIKCIGGYFLSNNGKCERCKDPLVQSLNNNCIFCNDTSEGGIEGCEKCFSDNGKIACYQCKEGFILEENSQKCLKLSEKREIQEFVNCQRVSLNKDNKYSCSKCLDNYNLLRGKNESRCVNSLCFIQYFPCICRIKNNLEN